MNLYLLSQDEFGGWDTYDSCVVAAKNETEAKSLHPDGKSKVPNTVNYVFRDWTNSIELVECELIGKAKPNTKAGVICASFNAG